VGAGTAPATGPPPAPWGGGPFPAVKDSVVQSSGLRAPIAVPVWNGQLSPEDLKTTT